MIGRDLDLALSSLSSLGRLLQRCPRCVKNFLALSLILFVRDEVLVAKNLQPLQACCHGRLGCWRRRLRNGDCWYRTRRSIRPYGRKKLLPLRVEFLVSQYSRRVKLTELFQQLQSIASRGCLSTASCRFGRPRSLARGIRSCCWFFRRWYSPAGY